MAYLKPPAFVRLVFNPLAMKTGMGGSIALAVPGRKSGRLQKLPVIPVEVGGARYLVSTRGESDWVKNLRAAGRGEQLGGGAGKGAFRATEVPVAERPPILDAYRRKAGKTVEGFFRQLPDPADHPVFRIEAE